MLVDGVEKSLDIHLALLSALVEAHLDIPSRNHLAIQGILQRVGAIVEEKFGRNLLQRGVQQDFFLIQNNDRVDDILQISGLVSGDDDAGIVSGVLGNGLAELSL